MYMKHSTPKSWNQTKPEAPAVHQIVLQFWYVCKAGNKYFFPQKVFCASWFFWFLRSKQRWNPRYQEASQFCSPDWRDQLQIPLPNPPAKHKAVTEPFLPLSSSAAWDTFRWGSSSACKKPIISSKPQTLENMGCAIPGLLFKEASVLSIWQLFIIAVALRNNNSHDNCFSYIKMLQSLFPTTFCLSGMCVPMSPQS